jgi:integrase
MTTTKKRAGRKPKSFKTADNRTIDGLLRETDGRWKIVATGKRFTEPDERLAVAKFFELTGAAPAANAILLPSIDAKKYGKKIAAHLIGYDGLSAGTKPIVAVDEIQFWARVRREILTRPKWVAEQVGIEEIGYLTNLKKPEKLPTPSELETMWTTYATCTKKQIKKTAAGWKDFLAFTKIESIADITPELVVSYRDDVHSRSIKPKQQQHMFGGIRRILSFAKSRAVAVNAISTTLNYLSILSASENATSLDPHPIAPEDFQKMLAKADPEDKAMILLMLNGAFYLQEAIRLTWEDIDNGTIVTRRKKQGECIRVCVLWPETIEALNQLPRKGDYIFINWAGKPLGVSGAHLRFVGLRDKAEVPHVCSSHLRDGAYTAAVESNVSGDLCRLLVGHRTGMADHYVARKPQLVKPACESIHAKYFETAPATIQLAKAG